jgi:isocitrate dehydrogenase
MSHQQQLPLAVRHPGLAKSTPRAEVRYVERHDRPIEPPWALSITVTRETLADLQAATDRRVGSQAAARADPHLRAAAGQLSDYVVVASCFVDLAGAELLVSPGRRGRGFPCE